MTEEVRLRRLFRIVNGGTPTSDDENWGGPHLWATPVDLSIANGSRISTTARTVTDDGLKGTRQVPKGSLIISTRAPIGYVAETVSPMAFNQGCRGLTPLVDLDLRYFRYQLLASTNELGRLGLGTTFSELSREDLANFPVYRPSLEYQREVADALDRDLLPIDEAIAGKRRQKQRLADRMRAAAHSATAGGDLVPLRRLVHRVQTGTTPPNAGEGYLQDDGPVEWLSPGDFGNSTKIASSRRRLSIAAMTDRVVPNFPRCSVVIVGIGATAGKVGYLDRPASGNQQLTCLEANARIDPQFLAWQLYGRAQELRVTAPYTTLPILNNEFLRSRLIHVPTSEDQLSTVETLNGLNATSNALLEVLNKQILLLQSRRIALVNQRIFSRSMT